MPNIPTIPNFPPQGIQAQLDLLYLYNPDAANKLVAQLEAGLLKIEELQKEIEKALQDMQGVLRYKGSVQTEADLPTTGNVIGDVWNIISTDENVAWTGTEWDKFGSTIDASVFLTKDAAKDAYINADASTYTLATLQDAFNYSPARLYKIFNEDKMPTKNTFTLFSLGWTYNDTNNMPTLLASDLQTGKFYFYHGTYENCSPTTWQEFTFGGDALAQEVETNKNDLADLGDQVHDIEAKIPGEASTTNQLVAQSALTAADNKINVLNFISGNVPYTVFNPADPTQAGDFYAKIEFPVPTEDGEYVFFTQTINQNPGMDHWCVSVRIKDGQLASSWGAVKVEYIPSIDAPDYQGIVSEATGCVVAEVQNGKIIFQANSRGPLWGGWYNEQPPAEWVKVSALYKKTTMALVSAPAATDAIASGINVGAINPYKTNLQQVMTRKQFTDTLWGDPTPKYFVLNLKPSRAGTTDNSSESYNYIHDTHTIALWFDADNYFFAELSARDKWVWTIHAAKGAFENMTASIGTDTDGSLPRLNIGPFAPQAADQPLFEEVGLITARSENQLQYQNMYTSTNKDGDVFIELTPEAAADGLPDQTGHTGFLQTDGTTATWSDAAALVNNAKNTYGLAIGQGANAGFDSIAFGISSLASGNYSVSIGQASSATAENGIAVGQGAHATASYAIQIGAGTNSVANTLQIKDKQLLKDDGTIPAGRLAADGTAGQVLAKTDTGMQWIDANAGGDYLPLSGGQMTGYIKLTATRGIGKGNSTRTGLGDGDGNIQYEWADTSFRPTGNVMRLGTPTSPWAVVYTPKLNNGADIAIPTTGGTMALVEDLQAVTEAAHLANGVKGDYCSTYAVIKAPNGRPKIKAGATNTVTVPAGLVFDCPLSTDPNDTSTGLITWATQEDVEITETTTDCFLVYVHALGEFKVCNKICFTPAQPEEGTEPCMMWFNGEYWQLKSDDTGNVWHKTRAHPVCKCIFTNGVLTRLNYIGWYDIPEDVA